jgi:hypothetical protein
VAVGRGEIVWLNSFLEEDSVDTRKVAPGLSGEWQKGHRGFQLTVSLRDGKLILNSLEEF